MTPYDVESRLIKSLTHIIDTGQTTSERIENAYQRADLLMRESAELMHRSQTLLRTLRETRTRTRAGRVTTPEETGD